MYGYGYSYPNNPQGSGLMGRYEAGVRSDGGSFAFPIDTGLASRLEGLGLLNASSLVNSCNAGKESVLYNLIPTPVQSLDRFAVTRSTVKWVLGANGLLQEIPANTPAFEYNTDGTYRGLLVEPAGTNLCLQSQAFAISPWARNATGINTAIGTNGIEPNVAIAPDGTLTADRVNFLNQADADAGLNQSFATSASTAYTNSIFVKGEGSDIGKQIRIRIRRNTGTANTVTVTPTLTGDWQRISTNYTTLADNTSVQLVFSSASGGAVTALIWQNQFETGSVATSIIPTVASTQTRTADSVTLTGASSLIGQTEGTLYAMAETRLVGGAGLKPILTLSDGTDTNRIIITKSANDANQAIVTATTDQASISSASNQSGVARYALAYASNDFAFYVNGVQIGTDASGTVPATNRIDIGQRGTGATFLNGWIRSVVLFPTRIPNATLAALTQ